MCDEISSYAWFGMDEMKNGNKIGAVESFEHIFQTIMANPLELLNVEDEYLAVGQALLNIALLDNPKYKAENVRRMLYNNAYLFSSKEIQFTMLMHPIEIKEALITRLKILHYGRDIMLQTLCKVYYKNVAAIPSNETFIIGAYNSMMAADVVTISYISSLSKRPSYVCADPIYLQMKEQIDKDILTGDIPDDIVEIGNERHQRVISYLEETILEHGDIFLSE